MHGLYWVELSLTCSEFIMHDLYWVKLSLTWVSHTSSLWGDRCRRSYSPCHGVPPAVGGHCSADPATGRGVPACYGHLTCTILQSPVFSRIVKNWKKIKNSTLFITIRKKQILRNHLHLWLPIIADCQYLEVSSLSQWIWDNSVWL